MKNKMQSDVLLVGFGDSAVLEDEVRFSIMNTGVSQHCLWDNIGKRLLNFLLQKLNLIRIMHSKHICFVCN